MMALRIRVASWRAWANRPTSRSPMPNVPMPNVPPSSRPSGGTRTRRPCGGGRPGGNLAALACLRDAGGPLPADLVTRRR
jgi:hypothetical protein